jgi:hypothetical protein
MSNREDAMSLIFNIGEGDTSPGLDFAITPTSIVLTGANVVFRWRPVGAQTWTNTAAASVHVATVTPTLRYTWNPGETDVPGLYEAQFVVTYADSTVETFPNAEFITISVNGLATADSQRIANVRFLVGDSENLLTNRDILFALDQTSNVYAAAAICARALAARYARRVDTRFETVETKYSQLRDSYEQLARSLDQQAKRRGGMGLPIAGGISKTEVELVDADTDRVKPFFYDNWGNNPPPSNE